MDKKFALPDNYFYWQDQNFIIRFLFSVFNEFSGRWLYLFFSPAYKKWNFLKLAYKDLAVVLGFDDEKTRKTISFHEKRLWSYTWLSSALAGILLILFTGFIVILSLSISWEIVRDFVSLNRNLIFALWFLFYIGLVKILYAFLGSAFSESLTTLSSIDILVELWSDDVLSNIRKKRMLVKRINQLAQHTLWLSIRNRGTSTENQIWLRSHFRGIVRFIHEQEKSVLASKQTTLTDLRENFYYLAQIFISGNYGEFDKTLMTPLDQQERLTPWQRVLGGLTRFIAVFVPLGVIGYLILQPTIIKNLGIDPGILSLIFMAWLLLALDNFFKLGIISTIFSLAKEIRDLRS